MIYLDYNATTPVDPRVEVAVMNALKEFGNPSSSHISRSPLARLIGARQD